MYFWQFDNNYFGVLQLSIYYSEENQVKKYLKVIIKKKRYALLINNIYLWTCISIGRGNKTKGTGRADV